MKGARQEDATGRRIQRYARGARRLGLSAIQPGYYERHNAVPFYRHISETGIAFVHIPKAAGSSLSDAVYGAQIGHLRWYDIYWSNPWRYRRLLKFAICRDPLERFASAYYFLKAGGMNDADRAYGEAVLRKTASIDDFAKSLADEEMRRIVLRKVHFHSQTSFVCDRRGRVRIDYLIDFAALESGLRTILPQSTMSRIRSVNTGPKRASRDAELSSEGQDIVRKIYDCDFRLMKLARSQPVYGVALPAR